ncbi:AT-rich interactive domain-containing protein 5B [Polymixia lowei]
MEPGSPTWVGSPCGLHGPYIFYKAFRFHLDGKPRILSLGDFFLVRCLPGEPVCIAELQLLWEERTNKQLLSSSKLYFLPEDTPQGRTVNHGEDEVIAVSEKVIVRLEDLVKWTMWDPRAWSRGMKAAHLKPSMVHRDQGKNDQRDPPYLRYRESTLNSGLNFKDVLREKAELGEDSAQKRVLVLSYPQYCRYRSVLARLRERPPSLLTDQVVLALGGIASLSENTHVLYCRDTFDHPTLLHNESVCDEFAPNLKGRPRKKKPSVSQRRDSQGQGQGSEVKGQCHPSPSTKETCTTEGKNSAKVKADRAAISRPKGSGNSNSSSNGSSNTSSSNKRTPLPSSEGRIESGGGAEECRAEEQAFLVSLYKYMKERKTPIERIPYLGFKQINLWTMFQAAQKLGGYELITARRQWKNVYDELGGNPGSTSAATCTRRHYERLILPYERFTKGEEDKPLPPAKPRKQEVGSGTELSSSVNGHTPKTKLTNGVKQQAHKLHPETEDVVAIKVQDLNTPESVEKASQLKVEPQILVTRLDPPRLLRANRERLSAGEEDGENGREVRLALKEEKEEEERRNRRKNGCVPQEKVPGSWETDPSCLPTTPMTKDSNDVLTLATPKVLNHTHPAVDQQAEAKDQCHVGMVSPTLKHRALQSPDPPSEQAELPRREDTFLGYSSLLYPPRINPGIMSPLAKKKLLSQVSGTGLPNHNHFPSPFGPPPPLISSGITNSITAEATGQPVTASNSPVAIINRPSVIQHAQSLKTCGGGVEERREGIQRDTMKDRGERQTSPILAHEHHLHPPPHPSIPHSHPRPHSHPEEPYHQRPSPPLCAPEMPRPGRTPPVFISDLYSSSHLHSLYRKTESHLSQGQDQGLRQGPGPEKGLGNGLEMKQVQGASEIARRESKQHHPEKHFRFPSELVNAESKKHHQQQHDSSFANELAHDDSKQRQQQGSSLPRDTESSASFHHTVPHPHRLSNSSARFGPQDKSAHNGERLRTTAATDDQPTDLSLPKSSPLKPFRQPSSSQPPPHPTMHHDSSRLSRDSASPPVFQNGHRVLGVAYHPRACRVPPMTVSALHTHTPVQTHTPRQSAAGDPRPGAAEKTVTPQNVCAARPLKRPLEEPENGTPERKIRAVTPMHASSSSSCSSTSSPSSLVPPKDVVILSSCPSRNARTPEEPDGDSAHAAAILKPPPPVVPEPVHAPHVHISGGFAEGGGGGQKGGVAAPLPLLPTPTAPHIPPSALYPAGAFSLSQVQDLCRDPLGSPLTTGYPLSPHSHPHHPLQYLKNQSAAFLSPYVPPFAIHSFMMQRQLFAQGAASPAHMYRHPVTAAASYGDLLHHGLYPVSINPQPAFSPPQLNSVHPSTKLS